MPLTPADLEFRYSTPFGTAGNTQPRAGETSFGKYVSQTVVPSDQMHNLFGPVTAADGASGAPDYECVFLLNRHPTSTLANAKVWIAQESAGGASVALATDNIAVSPVGSAAYQAAVIPDRHTAPSGVSAFSSPTAQETGLELGPVGPGEVKAIWIRRTPTTEVLTNDGALIRVAGDPA